MAPKLDTSPAAHARRQAEISRRLSADPTVDYSISGTVQRARQRAEAEIEAEELAAATSAAAQADAATERARIAAVVKIGIDTGRRRQALRVALSAPVSAGQAEAILAALPLDADAPDTALAMPGLIAFGPLASQSERTRIIAIMGHPDAACRFRAASAIALEGEETIPSEAALALLAGLPREAEKPRHQSIEERQKGLAEFGPGDPAPTKAEGVREGWARAARAANASIGVIEPQPVAPTLPGADLPGTADVAARMLGRT